MYRQKFYCQVCEKSCKDENGYKVHSNTPGHISKMNVVAEDPDYYINKYSKQFENDFITLLKNKHKNDLVSANYIYLDYIRDNKNVHLNATRWDSLTKFLFFLKRKGIIDVIDENKDGKFKIKLLIESANFNSKVFKRNKTKEEIYKEFVDKENNEYMKLYENTSVNNNLELIEENNENAQIKDEEPVTNIVEEEEEDCFAFNSINKNKIKKLILKVDSDDDTREDNSKAPIKNNYLNNLVDLKKKNKENKNK